MNFRQTFNIWSTRIKWHIQHAHGTDNFLINAMMKTIIEEDLHDEEFVASRCENFDAFRENLKRYNVGEAAKVCGVDADDIRAAARMYAQVPDDRFFLLVVSDQLRSRAQPNDTGLLWPLVGGGEEFSLL